MIRYNIRLLTFGKFLELSRKSSLINTGLSVFPYFLTFQPLDMLKMKTNPNKIIPEIL